MKKTLTKKEIYIRNQKKAKIYTILTPIAFWGLLVLSVLFFVLAVKNSAGNMNEITTLLKSRNYTGEELRANYDYLAEKYGEWVIGNGSTGFHLTFIDVENAVFGAFAIFAGVSALICFIGAFVLVKCIFPFLVKKITQANQDLTNLTVLEMSEEKNAKKE